MKSAEQSGVPKVFGEKERYVAASQRSRVKMDNFNISNKN